MYQAHLELVLFYSQRSLALAKSEQLFFISSDEVSNLILALVTSKHITLAPDCSGYRPLDFILRGCEVNCRSGAMVFRRDFS